MGELSREARQPPSAAKAWDCFASYRLSVQHAANPSEKSVSRDSWHRFSGKKRSHGWCDFTQSAPLLDARGGFLAPDDTLVLRAEVILLHESALFEPLDGGAPGGAGPGGRADADASGAGPPVDALSGRFTWRVHNFSLFQARHAAARRRGWTCLLSPLPSPSWVYI